MPRFAANLTMLFQEHDFLDRFGEAARAGFRGVEFLFPYEHRTAAIAERLARHQRDPPVMQRARHRGVVDDPLAEWPLFVRALVGERIDLAIGGVEDRDLAPAAYRQRPRAERGELIDRADVEPFADRAHAVTKAGAASGRISARCWWSL